MELRKIISQRRNTPLTVTDTDINKVNNTDSVATKKTKNDVDRIAMRIADKLNNPNRFQYYCKVAWSLPEHIIWSNLEQAAKGRNPQRLFTYLCQQAMK